MRTRTIVLIVSDMRLPGGDGIELLTEVCKHHPAPPFIFITGFPEVTEEIALTRGTQWHAWPFRSHDFLRVAGAAIDQSGCRTPMP